MRLSAAAALAFLGLTSCFVGRDVENEPVPLDALAGFEPGKTTARQVVEKLGAPVDIVQLGRRSAYLYRHTQSKRAGLLIIIVGVFNEDIRSDRVWLFFDDNDILTHAGATHASHHASHALPWSSMYDPEDLKEYDEERRRREQGGDGDDK